MTTESIPVKVKRIVAEIDSGAKVFLFGSRARGDFKPDSDWDFLILTSMRASPELRDEIRRQLYFLELENEQIITTVIEQKTEWEKYINSEFYANVAADGIPIELPEAA